MVVCLMRKMRDFICVGKIRDVLGMLCIIGKMKDGVNGREGVGWCVLQGRLKMVWLIGNRREGVFFRVKKELCVLY